MSPHVFKETADVLFIQLIKVMYENSLSSEISEIDQGGSSLSIDVSLRGLTIYVSGYSDMTKKILIMAVERIKHKDEFIIKSQFEFARSKLQRSYNNALLINSQEQADMIFNAFIRSYYHYPSEMLKGLEDATF